MGSDLNSTFTNDLKRKSKFSKNVHSYRVCSFKYSENTQKDQNSVFKTYYHLNACQKYYRTLQGEHSAILSSFTKIPFVIKTGLLSIFEWPILAVSSYTHMRICIHVGTPLIISKFATSEIWITLFLSIFDPRSSIVKSVFDCHLSGVKQNYFLTDNGNRKHCF